MTIERRLDAVEQRWSDHDGPDPLDVPDQLNIIDFCVSVLKFTPYPVQALLFKLIVGAVELLTDEDLEILERWSAGYNDVNGDHFVGTSGTTPIESRSVV